MPKGTLPVNFFHRNLSTLTKFSAFLVPSRSRTFDRGGTLWKPRPKSRESSQKFLKIFNSSTTFPFLTRLRIGHSHLTHAHLLRGDPPSVCEYCRRPLSIRHLLITCSCYVTIHSRHYRSINLNPSPITFSAFYYF